MMNISEKETKRRFQKLRNFEVLHPQLKERHQKLKEENHLLKKQIEELKDENKQIEKLQLQLEELRALKFGKRRQRNEKVKLPGLPEKSQEEVEGKKKREPSSYRRKIPSLDRITDHLHLGIEICPECGEELKDKNEHVHYREDLKKVEELLKTAKQIVETTIESGKCRNPECDLYQKRSFALEIPKQHVILGENIRRMVVYQVIIQGQSYREVQKGLSHQYGIHLSSGEIVNALEGESKILSPYYSHLIETLSPSGEEGKEGAHYDETTWKSKSQGRNSEVSEGNYAWIKASTMSEKKIFWFGRSRGKRVAESLRGEKKGSIGVSDDYGSYKNLFDHHQLCWAHPHRKLRDLAESGSIKGRTLQVCKKAHTDFADLYKRARKARERLLIGAWGGERKKKEKKKLERLFSCITEPHEKDPEKLKTIRKTLKERMRRYFTFFDFPHLPLDNNKAERGLRKLVLKRKKSFGSKSQKGADTLSILYSVVFSFMDEYPGENFFVLYEKAACWGQ